jgi:Zn-finger nucleic acid-binding protein
MRTYDRQGVQLEQCDRCRGIFLDYGELEAISRIESQWSQHPAQHGGPPPPAWGPPPHGEHGHHGKHRQRGFGRLLFSS